MNIDVTQKLTPQDLRLDPFPYFYVQDALPADVYQQLADEYPESYMMQDGKEHFQARRYRQHEFVEGTVSPLWQQFTEYHNSLAFKNRLMWLFDQALKKYYPESVDAWQNAPVVQRHGDKPNSMQMEIQFVLNGTQEETVRTAHLDNGNELWAGLFYMRKPEDTSSGGDLQAYKATTTPRFHGKREVDLADVEAVATLPYVENSLVWFLNTKESIHGVTPRLGAPCVRRYINMTAHADRKLFKV